MNRIDRVIGGSSWFSCAAVNQLQGQFWQESTFNEVIFPPCEICNVWEPKHFSMVLSLIHIYNRLNSGEMGF